MDPAPDRRAEIIPDTHVPTDGQATGLRRLTFARRLVLGLSLVLAMILAAILSYQLFLTFSDQEAIRAESEAGGARSSENLQFLFLDRPADLPDVRFVDGDAKARSLHDFRGRPIVLNVWATWCVPCRKEMPSLDRLQAKFDPSRLLVLALSIDKRGIPAVTRFYQELGLKSLGVYVDQSGAALGLVGAPGIPITLLVNSEGQEIGRKIGPAEWDSPASIDLLRGHMRLPADGSAK